MLNLAGWCGANLMSASTSAGSRYSLSFFAFRTGLLFVPTLCNPVPELLYFPLPPRLLATAVLEVLKGYLSHRCVLLSNSLINAAPISR